MQQYFPISAVKKDLMGSSKQCLMGAYQKYGKYALRAPNSELLKHVCGTCHAFTKLQLLAEYPFLVKCYKVKMGL